MLRSRGFSLLEVMLALVVVAIGISVLLTFSASNQRDTSSKAIGNDYSLVVNNILKQFTNQIKQCNAANTAADCPLTKSSMTAYEYLFPNPTSASDEQYNSLKASGVDLKTITVSLTSSESDIVTS